MLERDRKLSNPSASISFLIHPSRWENHLAFSTRFPFLRSGGSMTGMSGGFFSVNTTIPAMGRHVFGGNVPGSGGGGSGGNTSLPVARSSH